MRPWNWWVYMHYLLEDLYFCAGIFGAVGVFITVMSYYKNKDKEIIDYEEKKKVIKDEFLRIKNDFDNSLYGFKKEAEKIKFEYKISDNYQDILKDKKDSNKTYLLQKNKIKEVNIDIQELENLLRNLEEISRKYNLYSKKKDFFDIEGFLKLYSQMYSFSENIEHEESEKLFKKFCKQQTKAISKIVK